MVAAGTTVLPFGSFFGKPRAARSAGGFELTRMWPTVPEREVERHTHEDAHFILVTRGTYLSTALGAPAVCDPPALIYNPPGTTHRDRFLSDWGRFVTISVTDATLREAREVLPLPDHALFLGPAAVAAACRIPGMAWDPDGAGALAIESLCLGLLDDTARNAGPSRPRPPRWLGQARELLHDQCSEDLSVASIAAALGVHPVHLTRAFRVHFRITPGDYLRRCRLEKAAGLLAGSSAPLSDVALACGFCDQSHLTRAFRRAYRTTPGAYRRAKPARRRHDARSVQDAGRPPV